MCSYKWSRRWDMDDFTIKSPLYIYIYIYILSIDHKLSNLFRKVSMRVGGSSSTRIHYRTQHQIIACLVCPLSSCHRKTSHDQSVGVWIASVELKCPRVSLAMDNRYTLCVLFVHMMTSSNGNMFRVTGHLCGEFTGPRWIPRTKASDAELWCFLWSAPWINGWVWWFETPTCSSLWRHCNANDDNPVPVMSDNATHTAKISFSEHCRWFIYISN